MMMNVFHFSKNSPDFSIYDISPCFEPDQQMHLMASEQNIDIRCQRSSFHWVLKNGETFTIIITVVAA